MTASGQKGEELSLSKCGPVSTRKQTSADRLVMSLECQKPKCLALRVTASNAGSETDRVWLPLPLDRLAPPSDLSPDVQSRREEHRREIVPALLCALRHYHPPSAGWGLSNDKLPVSIDRCLCKHPRSIRCRQYISDRLKRSTHALFLLLFECVAART